MDVVLAALKALGGYKDGVDTAQSLLTIAALLLGGAWAYLKFARGRVFSARLEPTIEGRLCRDGARQFAVIKVFIKNVGLSRVDLDLAGSTIEVLGYPAGAYVAQFHNAMLDELGVVQGLMFHAWIEPGEAISEERIVALPADELLALRLQFRVLRTTRLPWSPRIEWNAVAVVTPEPPKSDPPTPPGAAARKRSGGS